MASPLVLVADNDLAVSSLLCEVLRRAGLSVEAVYDGEAALLRAAGGGVAVLVCDLDMPRRPGMDVLLGLAAMAMPPRVLVISGYLDVAVRQQLAGLPWVCGLLQKPFDLREFCRQVAAMAGAGLAPAGELAQLNPSRPAARETPPASSQH